MSLRLDWASAEAATYAVKHWHYSGTMPVTKTCKIGVWENGQFVGCVVFACGSAGVGSIGKRYGLANTEVAELARVALRRHLSPVTRIVAVALRLLKKAQPGLRLIVSYADPAHGHVGAIYQGGGWVYVGRSSTDKAYVDKQGRRWHSRSVSESGYKVRFGVRSRCPKPSDLRAEVVEPKFKYFMPLDDEIRGLVLPMSLPYPKRCAGGDTRDTPTDQVGKGGSTPTPALQHSDENDRG